MITRFRRLLPAHGSDLRLVLPAWVWLAAADVVLRLGGLRWFLRPGRGGVVPGRGPVTGPDLSRAHACAKAVEAAAGRHYVRARCLHRALALHLWLRCGGLPSQLQIGVEKDGGALNAHAWVELAGEIVYEAPATVARFTPLRGGTEHAPLGALGPRR